ncbi:hypothetical protein Deba_2065 [Desulfarculus baarsii DSM 2075]|uniref:Uncharacterized protein n=1 Tax=Desulfarculus baarsii (strain ATCC 33931 / DSM 2075 / LMG 7858 / VKM B-1802 / 2st14) TaxID=644282 RepID=E1QIB3_DESB2|nr:hypothetical protein [Desulfarculus baarsii]ADK85430.1 hypothetical protein Deba_2065 [Desulfarculus baarsii DSM 2075]
MKALFCFVDDAQFELDNFVENAAPAFGRAEFVCARTFAEAAEAIGSRVPVCFLLDILGGDSDFKPQLPTPQEMVKMLGKQPGVERLYAGVEKPTSAEANLLLRRVYAYVDRVQMAFRRAAGMMGQGRHYGLDNLAAAREAYPWAAALGYSRKALYADGVAMSMAGADGLLQKPQGEDDEAIALATRQLAPALARMVYGMVEGRLLRVAAPLALELQNDPDKDMAALGRAMSRAVLSLLRGNEAGRMASGRGLEETLLAIKADGQAARTAVALASWLLSERSA